MTAARKRALAVAIALIVAAVVGAGIALVTRGGNATASSNTAAQSAQAPSGGAGRNSAAFQQFRQCMQANGAPTLQSGTRPDPNDPAFAKARQACSQYAPQGRPGGGFGGGPPGSGQNATPSSATTAADKLQATSERKVA
jgi:hypothetical protein